MSFILLIIYTLITFTLYHIIYNLQGKKFKPIIRLFVYIFDKMTKKAKTI